MLVSSCSLLLKSPASRDQNLIKFCYLNSTRRIFCFPWLLPLMRILYFFVSFSFFKKIVSFFRIEKKILWKIRQSTLFEDSLEIIYSVIITTIFLEIILDLYHFGSCWNLSRRINQIQLYYSHRNLIYLDFTSVAMSNISTHDLSASLMKMSHLPTTTKLRKGLHLMFLNSYFSCRMLQ